MNRMRTAGLVACGVAIGFLAAHWMGGTGQQQTFAQAGRISGITPADITVIQIHLKKYHKQSV